MYSKLLFLSICLSTVLLLLSCSTKQKNDINMIKKEGFIEVTGGKVWYKMEGINTKTPIILLHGGPGAPSYYLNPLQPLSDERLLVFYDQLGCGRSDIVEDTSLFTIDIFVQQLEELSTALNIDTFYLYGQSWGAALAFEYYKKYPHKVKGLIFSSPLLSTQMWVEDAKSLVKTLPDSIQEAITKNEALGTYDTEDYQNAVNVFYENFVIKKQPWSDDVLTTFGQFNTQIYNYMWGPSEFTAIGTLKNYDATLGLKNIKVPVLYITGEFDEATPKTVSFFKSLTPQAEFVMIKDAAHLTMHDKPEENIKAIRQFLNSK